MKRGLHKRGHLVPLLVFTFVAGIAVGWWAKLPQVVRLETAADVPLPAGTAGTTPPPTTAADSSSTERSTPPAASGSSSSEAAESALRGKDLRTPIDGARVDLMKGQFGDPRAGGTRGHEAVDIMAPRNTPVHAVEDGTIAKLFTSKQGGLTIYQFEPSGRFCYYYAHLENYASGLHEGQQVSRGDVIGYVGTTGNAPPNAPHLHFAIFALTPERHWWQGTALDPWTAFSH